MDNSSRIYVAGSETLIGEALVRELRRQGFDNLAEHPRPDLWNDLAALETFLREAGVEYVFVAAGASGGIATNQREPATLMLDNLRVATHIIPAAYKQGVKKLLYLASSCVYPRDCPQPMQVEALQTGRLEPTNAPYALAKLTGITLCQAYAHEHGASFITAIPANVFGTNDHFEGDTGHVIPSLMRRMHLAREAGEKEIVIWGTGAPRREFLFADDLASACIFVMRHFADTQTPINLGGGLALSIRELAEAIRDVVGFTGRLVFDHSRPDGMPVKVLDAAPLQVLGWQPQTDFKDALRITYDACCRSLGQIDRKQTVSLNSTTHEQTTRPQPVRPSNRAVT